MMKRLFFALAGIVASLGLTATASAKDAGMKAEGDLTAPLDLTYPGELNGGCEGSLSSQLSEISCSNVPRLNQQ